MKYIVRYYRKEHMSESCIWKEEKPTISGWRQRMSEHKFISFIHGSQIGKN